MGLEPTTSCLASRCSTVELLLRGFFFGHRENPHDPILSCPQTEHSHPYTYQNLPKFSEPLRCLMYHAIRRDRPGTPERVDARLIFAEFDPLVQFFTQILARVAAFRPGSYTYPLLKTCVKIARPRSGGTLGKTTICPRLVSVLRTGTGI